MKLFDIFKKRNENIINEDNLYNDAKIPNIDYATTREDKLQIDFYEEDVKLGQTYDTTRLVVDEDEPIYISDEKLYNCYVLWYMQNDNSKYLNPDNEDEKIYSKYYQNVLMQFDIDLLQTDEDYCKFVMKNLLDKKRVTKYLEAGMQEKPEVPCGNYIGGAKQENGYSEFFLEKIGEEVHNSRFMQKRRKEHNEIIQKREQKNIQNDNILSETNEDISK